MTSKSTTDVTTSYWIFGHTQYKNGKTTPWMRIASNAKYGDYTPSTDTATLVNNEWKLK